MYFVLASIFSLNVKNWTLIDLNDTIIKWYRKNWVHFLILNFDFLELFQVLVHCHGPSWERYSQLISSLWLRPWQPASVGPLASSWQKRSLWYVLPLVFIALFGCSPCAVYCLIFSQRSCYPKQKARLYRKSRTCCMAHLSPTTTRWQEQSYNIL